MCPVFPCFGAYRMQLHCFKDPVCSACHASQFCINFDWLFTTLWAVFPFCSMPGNFLLDARHCAFHPLEAVYFCVPVNILELCWNTVTWKQWNFWILLLRLIRAPEQHLCLGWLFSTAKWGMKVFSLPDDKAQTQAVPSTNGPALASVFSSHHGRIALCWKLRQVLCTSPSSLFAALCSEVHLYNLQSLQSPWTLSSLSWTQAPCNTT